MKEMCAIPKSAVVFHFAAVELWLRLGQSYRSPTALTSQYLAWDCYCTYAVQTPRVERRIFLEQIRPTVADQINAKETSL